METNSKYISLKTAAELYGYTRDHLGLMIRQNKLKGMKLGSYYVTTDEWMVDFIKKFADLNHPTVKSKLSNKFLAEVLASSSDMSLVIEKNNKKAFNPSEITVPKRIKDNLATNSDIPSDLGEKILNELKQYKPFVADYKISNGDANQTEIVNSGLSHAPYVILPIRKMRDTEREKVLNKIQQ